MKTDIVIIGSGIGSLSCGALLAYYGFDVIIFESHSLPGGAAHAFERNGFKFDSGPSLYSGLSYSPSANPLRQVLDLIEEDLPCVTYDAWGCCLPEGDFKAYVGADRFSEVLQELRGEKAVQEWRELQRVMLPLGKAAIALPSAAFRYDAQAIFTLGQFFPSLISQLPSFLKINGPFAAIMDRTITDPFIRNWLNLLCFMLSGLPASGTSAAEVAFMFADWYRPDVVLDYPLGGGGALVDALVRGLEKHGGKLHLNSHVVEILVKNKRATGIKLKNGQEIEAKLAVISNASIWNTLKLFSAEALPPSFLQERQQTPPCPSFMHLHLGIDGENLPQDLQCHYLVVNHWEVTAPQNVVAISIPSLLDPSLAPPGKHNIHVYTPATEPYQLWAGMDRKSAAYQQLKEQRAEVMWQALARIIPDIRSRCELTLVGTPLTHEWFLRRYQGSYGPALSASKELFPGATTPLKGLFCCGDSTFPGIGLPAVAASGMMLANTFAPLSSHLAMLKKVRY